jgi:hypothetical protein
VAVSYSTPQLISAGSNTATANVTGLDGGKRLLIAIGCRAASVAAPTTLTVGGVTATIVNIGGTDATFDFTGGRYLSLYEIPAGSAPGSGTQSCTITWTSADRVTMWVTEVTGDDGSGVDIALGSTNGTSHTVSGLDSTATGQSLFSICERGGTPTYAWTTSSTDEIAEGGASGCSLGIGRLTLGAAGSYSSQWTATGGTGQIAVIGIIIAEAASSSNYGVATETDTAVALVGSVLASYGIATETDAAVALVGSESVAYGVATETDSAVALVQDVGGVYGIATETDSAVALVGSDHAAYGVATETDAAVALTGQDVAAIGVATETDSAVALTGSALASYGIALENDFAVALESLGVHLEAEAEFTFYDAADVYTFADEAGNFTFAD